MSVTDEAAVNAAPRKYTLQLKGLDCANCTAELEEMVRKLPGVSAASIDFMTQRAQIFCEAGAIEKVRYTLSHFEDVKIVSQKDEYRRYVISVEGVRDGKEAETVRKSVLKVSDVDAAEVSAELDRIYVTCLPSAMPGVEAVFSSFSDLRVVSEESEMTEHVLQLKGLDCPTCAAELEGIVRGLPGVETASIDFMTQKMTIVADEGGLERAVGRCNNFEDVKVVGDNRKGLYDRKIKIKNLCCANCGRRLEDMLNKIDGVSANVDFMNMRIILSADNRTAYNKAVDTITGFEEVKIVDSLDRAKNMWKEHMADLCRIGISLVLLAVALVLDYAVNPGGDKNALYWVTIGIYLVSYLIVAYEVLWECVKNISHGRVFDENFLMTVASIGALVLGFITGEGFYEGVAVMLLYQIGELFQNMAVGASRRSITSLMDLKSEEATIISPDGGYVSVAPEDLRVGDMILVKAGEKIPTDGVIVTGSSAIDMKSINGEPVPREVNPGDEVLSGGVNVSGVLEIRVAREYKNCAVAKILDLVENATAAKANPEKFITKFARIYTPIVCGLAVIVAALVPTIVCTVGSAFIWGTYETWIYTALNFLLISCPCALVISVPLSYFGGIGRCADFGILVKGSVNIDELAKSTVAAFDKTGTLTKGTFAVTDSSSDRALALACAAEKLSSHPIAVAFDGIATDVAACDAEEVAGRGVKCTAEGKTLLCGNVKLLRENGVEVEEVSSVSTLVYVALDGEYVGVVYIDDSLKDGAREAIAELKERGFDRCVMLTGDSSQRAESIADAIGLDGCMAGLLPGDKLAAAEELKKEGKLLYVGDGINDAPVMVTSDCAVSMGKIGSDAAIEASDIVLLTDNIRLLPKAKQIAVGTRKIVFENIIGSLAVKVAIMILAVVLTAATASSLPLVIGIVGDVGVLILAILNSLRIKISFKDKKEKT
ncbi:MAG: cadmium-translocating P-type ATPase [Clostridia bacterium]|nr:cadmium-translocating P-type ATPase [Clostridia bacterium]